MANAAEVNLLTPETFENGPPHDVFDDLRHNDPVHGQPNPFGGTIWSLTRNADIRKVSGDVETFCSGQGITWPNSPGRLDQLRTNLMFNDPPAHTRLRAFVAKAFGPAVVARFEDWVSELCVKIMDEVEATNGAPFDAVKLISAALPSQVIASILGVHDKDRDAMVQRTLRAFGEADPEIGMAGAMQAYAETMKFALELRDWKLKEPGIDMATELAIPPKDCLEPLNDREYSEMIATFMTAGFETTHSMIAQSLILSVKNPAVAAAINTTDRKTLSLAVDELLRFVTPTMYFARTVTRETELHGKKLAVGDMVLLWYTAANRDPEVFDAPHDFRIGRRRMAHTAFGGGGPHFCVGHHLAKLEVVLLLQEIAKRGIRFEMTGKPRRLPSFFVNGMRELPMRVVV